MLSHIGIYGLGVMGENLARNIESKGYIVSVSDYYSTVVEKFNKEKGKGKNFIANIVLEDFVKSIEAPRKIFMMIKAGQPVDDTIDKLLPFLEQGDILIDGGNSNYKDTQRRIDRVESEGILYVGCGVSGGELGALYGPSLMPGGSKKAWPEIKEIFTSIAAKEESDKVPCCDWIGNGGAGHFVKMVHNGIEYGDMQLICEAYALMRDIGGLTCDEMSNIFERWNQTKLKSYLIEITRDILRTKDTNGEPLVDKILDSAMQKGTGKWAVGAALDESVPLTLITEAVFARMLSSNREERVEAAHNAMPVLKKEFSESEIDKIGEALYAAKIISYAQGYDLLKKASQTYKWDIDFGKIAAIWRGGCIIRSSFLNPIKEAFDNNKQLSNLMMDEYFAKELDEAIKGLRMAVMIGVQRGIALPTMCSALAYFDAYHCDHLPSNLLQAQRDYFGAHMFERIDRKRGEFFHHNWTGQGGNTASTVYEV